MDRPQVGQVVNLKDGRSGRVVQTYYTTPLDKKIAIGIYEKTNASFDLIPLTETLFTSEIGLMTFKKENGDIIFSIQNSWDCVKEK